LVFLNDFVLALIPTLPKRTLLKYTLSVTLLKKLINTSINQPKKIIVNFKNILRI